MLFPNRYPLPEDLGYPNGVREARRRWLAAAHRQRRWMLRIPMGIGIGLAFLFSLMGLAPMMIQRAVNRGSLDSHLSSRMPMGNAHLGAEYYNIASALVRGRGFSDPFVDETGPTAWMPPLLVWLQASLIWLFEGDRYFVMLAVVFLKAAVLAACAAAVIFQGKGRGTTWLAFGLVAAVFVIECGDCFAFTHDGWLILAGVTATLFGLSGLDRRINAGRWSRWQSMLWGALGGTVALASPVAGFAWAAGTTLCLCRRQPASWLIAGMVSVLVVLPWTVRNYVVLDKFVPVKSNAFFEFDQSMALDEDGVLDWTTFHTHPYNHDPEREEYGRLGEIAYLQAKRERFVQQVRSEPGVYLRKVSNRFIATTFSPHGFSEFWMGSCTLPLRWLIYPLPAVAVIVLLCSPGSLTSLQKWAVVLYVAYLFPYILCSYYPRYGFPLLAIKMLLCFWVIERIVVRLRKHAALSEP